jgi:hypothetical protein
MFSRLAAVAAIAVVVAGATTPGCHGGGSRAKVWVFEPSSATTSSARETTRSKPGEATPRVRLAGAINETLSFCFAIRPDGDPIQRPDIRIAPMSSTAGRIDPSAVTLYRMHAVGVRGFPGWHIRSIPPRLREHEPLDVLVPIRAPRGGLPATLARGGTYSFWVDVAVPKGTAEGTYTTSVELLSAGSVVGAVDVQMTVWPIVLPDEADVPVLAELDHQALFHHHVHYDPSVPPPNADDWRDHPRRSEMDALLLSTLRVLESHRLTPVLPGLSPTVKFNAAGGVAVDWDAYDAVVAPLLSGRAFFNRVALRHWPMPISGAYSSQLADSSRRLSGSAAMLEQYLAQCALHFEQKGWLDRCYAVAPRRATDSSGAIETIGQFANAVHAGSRRVPVASRGFPQDMGSYGWVGFPYADVSDYVDIWMPPAQFYDVEAMTEERKSGRRTWVEADRPPFSGSTSIHAPSTYARVLPWQAEELGVQALSIGRVNAWPEASTGPTPQDCVDFDPVVLLYPGRAFGLDEPVASVRLKHVRRGMEDAAYFRLLREHGLEHVATAVRESLAAYAGSEAYRTHFADGRPIGWADDPELFEAAREIMAGELIRASSAKAGGEPPQPFARTAAWRRFMLATRKIDMRVDGVRARLAGSPAARGVELETSLTIVNRQRAPVSGTVRWAELPQEWTTPAGDATIAAIAPGSARRVTLHARMPQAFAGGEGVSAIPVEFGTEDGETCRREARVAWLTAAATDDPIRIDGDLSDWPPGSVNTAGDFRLIAGDPGGLDGEPTARPSARTIGFVLRDRDYLYVAVNCESDPRTVTPTARHKGVHYDDLIPAEDEDLIEVLIDPLNGGTRSPGDLYHIAVKRSGTDLTEKGIGTDPPCGPRAPWAVDIEVATAETPRRWTAELRIPLQAVSPEGHDHAVWGFNITRWDASRQEFSTWSGAVGNAYDPLSLGNLYLP